MARALIFALPLLILLFGSGYWCGRLSKKRAVDAERKRANPLIAAANHVLDYQGFNNYEEEAKAKRALRTKIDQYTAM